MGGRIVPVVVVVVVGSEMMWRFLSKESKTGRPSVDMYQHQVHGFLVRRNENRNLLII